MGFDWVALPKDLQRSIDIASRYWLVSSHQKYTRKQSLLQFKNRQRLARRDRQRSHQKQPYPQQRCQDNETSSLSESLITKPQAALQIFGALLVREKELTEALAAPTKQFLTELLDAIAEFRRLFELQIFGCFFHLRL